MKELLTLFLLIVTISTNAQIKNTKTKVSEQTVIAAKAKKWFREVYVSENFKDPYSFKLLKFEIFPVTHKTEMEHLLSSSKEKLRNIDTLTVNKEIAKYNDLKDQYDRSVIENGKEVYATLNLKIRMNDQFIKIQKDTAGLGEAIQAEKRVKSILKNTPKSKISNVAYYYIDIDCYGSNSYGNSVLGTYSFKFNKNGLVGDVAKRD